MLILGAICYHFIKKI